MKFVALLFGLGLVLASPALHAQAFGRFAAYEHCRFADNLALVETTPLARGIEGRTVKTVMGNKNVPLTGGTRLMYAYPGTEPFANVKVEQIPTDSYKQARQDLIANFEQILTGDDSSTRNYTLKPRLNGLEIYGLDRKKLEGGVLGIYLFFVDRTHTATTIYFLNQDPERRKFASLEEYAPLRDSFINTYTHCAAGGASSAITTAAKLPPTAPTGESPSPTVAAPLAAVPPTPSTSEPALPDAPLPNGAAAAEAVPIAPTAAEPVARPVPGKKPTTKVGTKTPAKPAHAVDAKKAPAKKADTTHSSRKAAPTKEKAKADKVKIEKTKPAAPKKKKPKGES